MKMEDMTTQELLAMVLKIKPDDDMAREILTRYGTARTLYQAPVEEMVKIKGIGRRRANLIKAVLELGIRWSSPSAENMASIASPSEAFEYLKARMPLLDREHFVVMSLNTKNRVLDIRTVSIGTLSSSLVHPREVFSHPIKISAASIILVHNHPSGDPTPSSEDLSITRRLVEVGDLLGITVLDFLIIGNTCVSLREKGLL